MRIDSCTYGRAAQGKRRQAHHRITEASCGIVDLGSPAIKFLAQRDRHGVHQMRTPCLDDVLALVSFFFEYLRQMPQRRHQHSVNRARRTDMNASRNDVVAALAHVDVIVRMHL